MISDVLFESVEEIRRYLSDPAFRQAYVGEDRKEIEALVAQMEGIRIKLDTPPRE